MKKLLLLSALLTLSTSLLSAPAQTLPGKSMVTLDWTVYQEGGPSNSIATNHPSKGVTNLVILNKLTFTSSNFNNAGLLKLLENSFNTTFPTGSRLATLGTGLWVVDRTGTNVVLNPSAVLSFQSQNSVVRFHQVNNLKTTSSSTNLMVTTSMAPQIIYESLVYNDSSQNTADGTHSSFHVDGLYTSQSSTTETINSVKRQESFVFPGAGSGTIRNTNSLIRGTITGTSASVGLIEP